METPITKQLQERIDDYHKFRHEEAMKAMKVTASNKIKQARSAAKVI